MNNIFIKELHYNLGNNIGPENILKEYKEFFLRKSLTLFDFKDLQEGILTSKIKTFTKSSLNYYFDKYLKKYLCSLVNIDKNFLDNIIKENFSNFYIGVSDEGNITGIPIHKDYLPQLIETINTKLSNYYKDIIGLHYEKGIKVIQIGNETYYDFKKLLSIIKLHTKINIHILNKSNSNNLEYERINKLVNDILQEEKEYNIEKNIHKQNKLKKKVYNEKYSQSFNLLIRDDNVINEFKNYLKQYSFCIEDILILLKEKIKNKGDVEKFLLDGKYIKGSFYPNNSALDNYYGNKISKYLMYYKEFKIHKLKDNITIPPFCKKFPKLKLNSILKNISCFSQQFYNNPNVYYIMIHIELPFIKDKRVYLGLKDNQNIKIIKRTFETTLNMPCTMTN